MNIKNQLYMLMLLLTVMLSVKFVFHSGKKIFMNNIETKSVISENKKSEWLT
ncbi:MAG: hypothetical protein ACD_79C01214G0001, partial [uncultured bacterium]